MRWCDEATMRGRASVKVYLHTAVSHYLHSVHFTQLFQVHEVNGLSPE